MTRWYNTCMRKAFLVTLGLMIVFAVFGRGDVSATNLDNFEITNFDVDMRLYRDSEQRSVIEVEETVTAQFPDFDQNHGLERVFVDEYDGHPAKITLESVTDESGQPLDYSENNGVLRIGSSDKYVRGQKTYVINYTQRDVTRYYEDTDRDEFYWDAIGVDWRVPIQTAEVHLTISDSLRDLLRSDVQCYVGSVGATEVCRHSTATSEGYVFETDSLSPGQGMTLAVGFEPATFQPYQQSLLERMILIWIVIQSIVAPVSIAVLVFIVVRFFRITNRTSELKPIAPEYFPPKGVTVTTSAAMLLFAKSVMSAQLIDLAVRRYLKLYEVREKSMFRTAEYEIEITKDPTDLLWEERELLSDTFGALPQVGQRLNLKKLKNNMSFYRRTKNNDKDLSKLIKGEYGLKQQSPALKAWLRRAALLYVIVAVLFISPMLLLEAVILYALSFGAWQLSDEGLALRRYLEGLKMYISVAEEDRIKMLQSPQGAEKVAEVSAGGEVQKRIVLYEKVLPYAIITGHEKQWGKQLGSYYEQANQQPDWYAGHRGAFNAAVFSSALRGISSTTNSVSSSSSSTGGSSGGGSAGGGGGGGGGGGW